MRTKREFLRQNPACAWILKMYLLGLPISLLTLCAAGKPAACAVMMAWGGGMFVRLGRSLEPDSDERQLVSALSACAVMIGFVGLMGWA